MGPVVDLAGCWRFPEPTHFKYHVVLHHLIFVQQGGVESETEQGRFSARSGDLLCLRPARWSEYRTLPDTIIHQITVAFAPPPRQLATPVLPGLGPLPMHLSTGEFCEEMQRAFHTICFELPQDAALSQLRCKTAVYQILELVAAILMKKGNDHSAPLDEWEEVHAKLRSANGARIKIEIFAREMGYSPQHFRLLFKERFGETAQSVQMIARLRAATRQLRERPNSVKSIANEFGFAGAKGLTRAMQKHLGVTASEIRTNAETLPSLAQVMPQPFALNHHILPPGHTLNSLVRRYGTE